ncbi:hypothetical protein J9978_16960, partial [Chromobacterium violaceum]|uniref:hypothetical protein n=1 Tax=Chromobacterium violaceum TaxID=536 RepID=UPI001B3309D1
TYTYRLFVLLKSSAGRCVVITGTVSFPLFRSLRQLRRRTIPAPPPSVNSFFEKNGRFSRRTMQAIVFSNIINLRILRKVRIAC